jgi:hypothetical protein
MITTISAVLAFILVLSVPRHAEAECAWVLWADMGPKSDRWTTIEAVDKKKDCESYRERFTEKLKRDGFKPLTQDSPALRKGDTYFMRFICLPDTIDPRGLKGGTR